MAVKSGIPTTINGVQVGATDFSEFAVGAGLPAGITAFGSGLPTAVAIADTPLTPTFGDEGKYFEMTGQSGIANWAFGLDAFFGLIEQGEMLVRIYFNIGGVKNRCTLGPCMSIEDSSGISGAQACVFDASVSPPESGGGVFLNGGDALVGTFDIQEGIQDPEWMWFRARKTNNLASPSEDDWQVTAWYGDIEDEPVSPDGIDPAPQSITAPRGLFALGWSQAAFGSIFDQRIAFLSYSENPLVEPPPIPPLGAATIWTPFPRVFTVGLPKPVVGRPIVEFDVRQVRDDPQYSDGDTLRVPLGGVGWKDLETSDPQGRTDAGVAAGSDGNVLFVEDGWTPGIDAVRFVASPIGAPAGNGQGNYLSWPGGGSFPIPQNWSGNEQSYLGVMRCTDLTQRCCLFGGNSGIIPINGNPKKTQVWVEADGSIAMHQSDEETSGALQPGSIFSCQSAPGVIEPGDDVIIVVTQSALAGPRQGKTIRVNGIEVGRNAAGTTTLFTEMSAPTLGQCFPQQDGSPGDPGVIGGLDRLIVYFAAFGTLMTLAEIEAYESFLAKAFELNLGTQWTDQPEVSPGTVWANIP